MTRGKPRTHVGGQGGEQDNLVELRHVGEEVVGSGALGCPPPVFELSQSAGSRQPNPQWLRSLPPQVLTSQVS